MVHGEGRDGVAIYENENLDCGSGEDRTRRNRYEIEGKWTKKIGSAVVRRSSPSKRQESG